MVWCGCDTCTIHTSTWWAELSDCTYLAWWCETWSLTRPTINMKDIKVWEQLSSFLFNAVNKLAVLWLSKHNFTCMHVYSIDPAPGPAQYLTTSLYIEPKFEFLLFFERKNCLGTKANGLCNVHQKHLEWWSTHVLLNNKVIIHVHISSGGSLFRTLKLRSLRDVVRVLSVVRVLRGCY